MNNTSALAITTATESKTEAVPVFVLHTPQNTVPRHQAKHILLADDDPGIREMLGRVLQSEGYLVTTAQTGRQAFNRFSKSPPDLVLLDLNMPEQDGWQAFGRMCEAHPLVPVIVITARPQQQVQAADFGVDALMEKPLDLPVLLQAIHDLLAETEVQRTRRLTNPDFQTAILKPSPQTQTIPRLDENEKQSPNDTTAPAPDHPARG